MSREEHTRGDASASDLSEPEQLFVSIVDQAGQIRRLKPIAADSLAAIEQAIEQIPDSDPEGTHKGMRRAPALPAITSGHTTWFPGTPEFLTLTGSFGSSVPRQGHLWESDGFDIITPTGVLSVRGKTSAETEILQHYVEQELGPQGLKDLTALLVTYDFLTRGTRDQRQDVEVTLRQILQRIGLGNHAHDDDEQQHLLNTARYLARTYISVHKQTHKRTTPLLVLEEEVEAPDGTVTLRYHLGREFFVALYGPQPTRYALPTPQVLGYHSVKSKHELLFLFYLGNRIARGQTSLYLPTLCLESQAYGLEDLLPGAKNRMRDGQVALYALERLEKDEQIKREAHPDVDMVLAINLLQSATPAQEKGALAPATLERLQPTMRRLKGYTKKDLNAKRRIALQRLLNIDASREELLEEFPEYCTRLVIHPGPRLYERISQHEYAAFPLQDAGEED